jgi:nucleoside-diphosphate-sugar epimerase
MRILICGANGFLGINLLNALKHLNYEIDCFVNTNFNNLPPYKPYISKIINNVNEVKNNYDIVFLLSACIYPIKNAVNELIDANILFTSEIVKRCQDSHLIYSSSVSVIGVPKGIISEKSTISPIGLYGQSKLCGEEIVKLSKSHCCIRFSSIIGKGMNPSTFIPTIIKNAKENGTINLYGKGERLQNYIPIEDAVDLCLKAAMQREDSLYLGVYPIEYTNLEIAEKVRKFIKGVEIKFSDVDTSPSWKFDNSYTRLNLNKHEFESIDNTLQRIIET